MFIWNNFSFLKWEVGLLAEGGYGSVWYSIAGLEWMDGWLVADDGVLYY